MRKTDTAGTPGTIAGASWLRTGARIGQVTGYGAGPQAPRARTRAWPQ